MPAAPLPSRTSTARSTARSGARPGRSERARSGACPALATAPAALPLEAGPGPGRRWWRHSPAPSARPRCPGMSRKKAARSKGGGSAPSAALPPPAAAAPRSPAPAPELPRNGGATSGRPSLSSSGEFYDLAFKVMLVGDSGVGKTCLLVRFKDGAFLAGSFISTVGIDFRNKVLTVDGVKVKLQIWDTAGQERFRSVTHAYYRDAHALLLLYDVTNKASFDNIQAWLTEIHEYAQQDVVLMLLGNKVSWSHRAGPARMLWMWAGVDAVQPCSCRFWASRGTESGCLSQGGMLSSPEPCSCPSPPWCTGAGSSSACCWAAEFSQECCIELRCWRWKQRPVLTLRN
uniref:RAB26, member RAS oncogene family n=1 Tax=Pavo cristatus TaxID=9049 RepID=A0A8C9EYF0_PAVCR